MSRREQAEALQAKVQEIVYLGFGPALEDEVNRLLQEARATARRRGDQAVINNLAAIQGGK